MGKVCPILCGSVSNFPKRGHIVRDSSVPYYVALFVCVSVCMRVCKVPLLCVRVSECSFFLF